MKNLAFLFLLLVFCTACKQKEEKALIPPKEWLSQIKNEEAKKRTTDVLEKIHTSTAYSVLEKDSLSEMQVKFANCELYDETRDIRIFKNWEEKYYKGGMNMLDPNIKYLTPLFTLYEKDTAVLKAALNAIVDTTFIYFFEKPYSLEKFEKDTITNQDIELDENKPSNKILRMESEVVTLIKYAEKLQNEKYTRGEGYKNEMDKKTKGSIEKASKKLFQLLNEKGSLDYTFPKLAKEVQILCSSDKKLRVFYYKYLDLNFYDGIVYTANNKMDTYIQFKSHKNNEATAQKIDCGGGYGYDYGYCYSDNLRGIFQVEKNGSAVYLLISEFNYKKLEHYTSIQPIEIIDDKLSYCKSCIKEKTNIALYPYPNNPKSGSLISFDKNKQQISFTFNPLVEDSLNFSITKKYILQWNGEQFVPLHLKLYCDK
ncbi:hypothetical protein WAF17_10090 [Bernardetia sp. ABR2-2B]|uniref:hypothetical protein n=1 Tax=Bernardetia sp. ABR2-2B TaxID=3127472 RepID=UPI0030CD2D5C